MTETSDVHTISVGADPTEARFTVGVTEKNLNPYWDMVNAGFHDAGVRLGLSIRIAAPAYEDIDAQVAATLSHLEEGVDAIAFVASAKGAFTDACDLARKRSVPVLAVDLDDPDTGRLLYIGTEKPYELGRAAAKVMLANIDERAGGPVIVQTGSTQAPGAVGKLKGFVDTLRQAGVTTVGGDDDGEYLDRALDNARALLSAHPEAIGLYGVYAYHPIVQATALQERGETGRVPIVGFDMLPETAALIRERAVTASIWIREYYFGYLTAAAVFNALALGEQAALDLTGLAAGPPEERTLRLPTEVIDVNSVEAFIAWSRNLGLDERTAPSLPEAT